MTLSKHARSFSDAVGGTCCDGTITRRGFVTAAAALAAISLGGTAFPEELLAAAKKTPQKLVKYQTTPKNNRKCADCTFFMPADKTCKVVEGTIDPNGWCLRWAKKKA